MTHCLVLDIGKTNIKLHVLDDDLNSVFGVSIKNKVCNGAPYPHYPVDKIWQWILDSSKQINQKYHICSISITTHGATAALINRNNLNNEQTGLVLPIIDYEFEGFTQINEAYDDLRPGFKLSYSPNLPSGLNLGRQLYWQKQSFKQYDDATDILLYPQYWAWRFSNKVSCEVTSLGCHTDLWEPLNKHTSTLVKTLKLDKKIPPIYKAWEPLGKVTKTLVEDYGFQEECVVFPGIHDSNASLLRYRLKQKDKPFTVISTGTWTIMMSMNTQTPILDENLDMLANVNVYNEPVPCARFMGGREFEMICSLMGGRFEDETCAEIIQLLISQKIMALPDFSNGSGPFGGMDHSFVNIEYLNQDIKFGAELATLYCALMIDHQLDNLGSVGDIYIEGSFLKNPNLCAIVSQLRQSQDVMLSEDETGTVVACGYLTKWGKTRLILNSTLSNPSVYQGLFEYKASWQALLMNA